MHEIFAFKLHSGAKKKKLKLNSCCDCLLILRLVTERFQQLWSYHFVCVFKLWRVLFLGSRGQRNERWSLFYFFVTKIGILVYLNSTECKDLSNHTPIRVLGSTEHEICTKMLRNLSEKPLANFLWLHLATPGRNCPSGNCLLGNFWTASKPSRRSISAAKRYENEKRGKTKKEINKKYQKFLKRSMTKEFLKTGCLSTERRAIKLQMHFWLDWS